MPLVTNLQHIFAEAWISDT